MVSKGILRVFDARSYAILKTWDSKCITALEI